MFSYALPFAVFGDLTSVAWLESQHYIAYKDRHYVLQTRNNHL